MNRYLAKQLSSEFAATLIVITVLLLLTTLGSRALVYLREAAAGKLAVDVVVPLIALKIPNLLQVALPFATAIALAVVVSRAYAERELLALHAAGVSPLSVFVWAAALAGVAALLVAGCTLWLTPWSLDRFERLWTELDQRAAVAFLRPGRMVEWRDGVGAAYVDAYGSTTREFHGVFVVESLADGATQVDVARQGHIQPGQLQSRWEGDRFVLSNGERIRIDWSAQRLTETRFRQLAQVVQRGEQTATPPPRARATAQLLERADSAAWIELQWRFALPLLTLLGSLVAIAAVRPLPVRNRYFAVAPAVMAIVLYSGVLFLAQNLIERKLLPVWPGLLMIHAAVAVGVCFWIARRQRHA